MKFRLKLDKLWLINTPRLYISILYEEVYSCEVMYDFMRLGYIVMLNIAFTS